MSDSKEDFKKLGMLTSEEIEDLRSSKRAISAFVKNYILSEKLKLSERDAQLQIFLED